VGAEGVAVLFTAFFSSSNNDRAEPGSRNNHSGFRGRHLDEQMCRRREAEVPARQHCTPVSIAAESAGRPFPPSQRLGIIGALDRGPKASSAVEGNSASCRLAAARLLEYQAFWSGVRAMPIAPVRRIVVIHAGMATDRPARVGSSRARARSET